MQAKGRSIAIAVMPGAIMEALDASVANVSLSPVAGSLSAAIEQATWVLISLSLP
jgi:hypothetical protein